MPEMNATSLPDAVARTPTCHSFFQPGALRALWESALVLKSYGDGVAVPVQE